MGNLVETAMAGSEVQPHGDVRWAQQASSPSSVAQSVTPSGTASAAAPAATVTEAMTLNPNAEEFEPQPPGLPPDLPPDFLKEAERESHPPGTATVEKGSAENKRDDAKDDQSRQLPPWPTPLKSSTLEYSGSIDDGQGGGVAYAASLTVRYGSRYGCEEPMELRL